jgi:hypothetical protein
MYIYRGKITLQEENQVANSEDLTVIFFTSIELGQPVYACWQWTTVTSADQKTQTNVTVEQSGIIDDTKPNDNGTITIVMFNGADYTFEATTGSRQPPFPTLEILVRGRCFATLTVKLHYYTFTEPLQTVKWYFYVGKLNFNKSGSNTPQAKDETILIGLKETFAVKSPVCAYWQWTKASDKVSKQNLNCLGIIKSSDFTA